MFLFTGARIEPYLEGSNPSNIDKASSGHVKQLIIKVLAPVIKSIRNPPDNLEEYKQEYGYLGPALHNAVIKARTQPTPATTTISTPSSIPCSSSLTRTVTASSGIVQQVGILIIFRIKYTNKYLILQQTPPAGRTIVMNPTPRAQNPQGNQKFVFVTQRPQTPVGTSQQNQQAISSSQNTVVKFVQNSNQSSQKIGAQQKLVVVSNQGNSERQPSTLLISKPQQQQQQIQQQIQQQFQQQQLQQQIQQQQLQQTIISADDLSHLVE